MSHVAPPRESLHLTTAARFLQTDAPRDARADVGLQQVFRELFPVRTRDGVASLEFVDYQLLPARFDEDACRRRSLTHVATLKVTVRLVIFERAGDGRAGGTIRDIKEQEVYFGEVPLLGARGTWVVDGRERAPLLRLSRAPGVRHVTAPDGAPGVALTPQHGPTLTFWLDRAGALRVALDGGRALPGDALLGAYGLDPETLDAHDDPTAALALGRALADDAALDEAAAARLIDATFLSRERIDPGPLAAREVPRALGLDAAETWMALDPATLRAIVAVLRADRLLDEGPWEHQLRAAGDLYARHAREGLAATLDRARDRMERAATRDAVETLMPHDLLHAAPLFRAWRDMLAKSPLVEPVHARNPLARAAQAWRVRPDDDARDALTAGPFARWLTPDADGCADLSPDAPVNELGLLDGADGDPRPLAARLGHALLRRALPLEAPDAMAGDAAREVAAAGGAVVTARRAGRVLLADARRVWVGDAGSGGLDRYALRPRGAAPTAMRPVVRAGDEVAAGGALAEGDGARDGTLALGRRCTAERAGDLRPGRCRVSGALAAALATVETVRVDAPVIDTRLGKQRWSREVPGVDARALRHLDASGLAALGAEVDAGDVLAGTATPAGATPRDDGGYDEHFEDACVRAPVGGTVVWLDVFARRGVERGARHEAIVAAALADLDAECAERARCLAELRGLAPEDCADEAAELAADERRALQSGDDLPPGEVQRAVFALRVRRPLAVGDVLADLAGRCWTVEAIDAAQAVDLRVPDAVGEGAIEVVRVGEPLPPPPPARRPPPRARRSRA